MLSGKARFRALARTHDHHAFAGREAHIVHRQVSTLLQPGSSVEEQDRQGAVPGGRATFYRAQELFLLLWLQRFGRLLGQILSRDIGPLQPQKLVEVIQKRFVGPVDQAKESFGILVTEQSTGFIEGGRPTEFPTTLFSPKTLAQALPELAGYCVVVTLIRQALPDDAASVPPAMRAEINQQAKIADQFAKFDVDASQQSPYARIPSADLAPIR